MYSPKVYDKFIPYLYAWAKSEKITMSALVNRIIKNEIDNRKRKEQENDEQDKRNPKWDTTNI